MMKDITDIEMEIAQPTTNTFGGEQQPRYIPPPPPQIITRKPTVVVQQQKGGIMNSLKEFSKLPYFTQFLVVGTLGGLVGAYIYLKNKEGNNGILRHKRTDE